jgi:hypothetical protein
LAFVERIKNELGGKAMHRRMIAADGTYALRDPAEAYAGKFIQKLEALRTQNTSLCDEKRR